MAATVLKPEIPGVPHIGSGKVREIFDLGEALLLVASDRISAFDVIMPAGIPGKGQVLTQFSRFWFQELEHITPSHYLSTDITVISEHLRAAGAKLENAETAMLRGRSMLCVKARPLPIECVVRGYLAGSLWKEYVAAGGKSGEVTLHGIRLPGGLLESARLPEPIFTPATKAETGHDENIHFARAAEMAGEQAAAQARDTSIALYLAASERAADSGIILADTKFEFGWHRDRLILIDEALTPDSSRYWDAQTYAPGSSQPSFDKQFLRDWLEESGWDKAPPGPDLPPEIVDGTAARYAEAYQRIVGSGLPA